MELPDGYFIQKTNIVDWEGSGCTDSDDNDEPPDEDPDPAAAAAAAAEEKEKKKAEKAAAAKAKAAEKAEKEKKKAEEKKKKKEVEEEEEPPKEAKEVWQPTRQGRSKIPWMCSEMGITEEQYHAYRAESQWGVNFINPRKQWPWVEREGIPVSLAHITGSYPLALTSTSWQGGKRRRGTPKSS